MRTRIDRQEWDDLARQDAMWAVSSEAERRGGGWDADAFFATGVEEVDAIMAGLREADLFPRTSRALDFGCGLGRLSRALSRHFDGVVGVDISPEMVRRAQQLNADWPACTFVCTDTLDGIDTGAFDFVLSLIVLQHTPDPRTYIEGFVRIARPGAVLVFQLPTAVGSRVRLHPLRVLNRAVRAVRAPAPVRRALTPWSMRLTALPEADVRALLERHGAHLVTSFEDNRVGSDAVPSRIYVATR